VEHLREVLQGREIVELYRSGQKDFERRRLLTFTRVVIMILRGHKLALQNTVNKVFEAIGLYAHVPTASAYVQARQKVKPEVFVYLNQIACDDYYRVGGTGNQEILWHGRRLIGYDGTTLNLPDKPKLRAKYSVHRNQHTSFVQAQAGVLYDLRNQIGLGGALGPAGKELSLLQEQLWGLLGAGDVLVLDRNFLKYELVARAKQAGLDLLIRCKRNGPKAVQEFWDSPTNEQCIDLEMPRHSTERRHVHDQGLPATVRVRLLKFVLPTGETEVLLTTLLDQSMFPREELYQVYGSRWGQETYFLRIKHIFEIERFSGTSPETIQQDFFGVLFLATLESILTRQPQEELRQRAQMTSTATTPLINRANSYVALVDHVVALLVDPNVSTDQVLQNLHALFMKNPTRHRSGRTLPRRILKHSKRLRFHLYTKRIQA
jgi:hypothetical protein